MRTYQINDIFPSIQGEGHNTGTPVTFIRFAKCNLSCSYCDTEFDAFKEMTLGEIDANLKLVGSSQNLVISGGEPLLQLDDDFVSYFREIGYRIFVETSGSVEAKYHPPLVNWTVCSPKVGKLKLGYIPDELRIPVTAGSPVAKFMAMDAVEYFFSPVFDGDQLNFKNINYCLSLLKEYPHARLSLQMHKWIGVR